MIAQLIETDGPGGAEILVIEFCKALRSRGYAVVPVLPTPRDGWLHEQLEREGFSPHSVELLGSPLHASIAHLRQIFQSSRVEVAHSHEFTMGVLGSVSARISGVRHIWTLHGNQTMTKALRRRVAIRTAIRLSQATTAVSEDTRRHLQDTVGGPARRIVTIPNGIPDRAGARLPTRQALEVLEDELLLLSVGSLVPRKGHDVLLRALHKMKPTPGGKRWKLAIAGQGDSATALKELAQGLGLADRVILLGQRSDIPDLQAAADVFVMPSLWEGLPLAVLEAMMAGNAVVASNISGIPEAIRHTVDGLLVPPGDEDRLADALRWVMADDALRKAFGLSARQRALQRFSSDAMIRRYEELYCGKPG